ncbi:alpha/beta fold hydrolase [Nocardia sp. NPDC055165]
MSVTDPLEPTTLRLRAADGLTLVADSFGAEGGPLVVMLHGGGQNRHSWKRTGRALAAAGMRVVAVDARGHGDSDWSPEADYSRTVMVADLHTVLEQLGATRDAGAVVVGASMGGITGLLATATPGGSAIRALVLVDIVPRSESTGVARVMDFLGRHRDGFDTLDQVADAVAAYLPHRPRPDNADGLLRNLRQRDGRWYWHWDPDLISDVNDDPEARIVEMEAAAEALTIPVLLIRGGKSDVVSDEGAAAFLALTPHARLAEISAAAHTAAGDDNDAFTEAVADFVATA